MNRSQRITTPKQFDEMIRVSGKWIWIFLSVLVVLTIGLLGFAFTQTIERTIVRYGQVTVIPVSYLVEEENNENPVMNSDALERYITLDNVNADMVDYTILMLISEEEMQRGLFNAGTTVRVGNTEGVVVMVDTFESVSYDEAKEGLGWPESVLMEMGVYPGQNYNGVLIGPPAMFGRKSGETAAESNGQDEESEFPTWDMRSGWLKDAELWTTEEGLTLAPCEIVIQSVKLASFILK